MEQVDSFGIAMTSSISVGAPVQPVSISPLNFETPVLQHLETCTLVEVTKTHPEGTRN
jgi:hypothetical protein